MARPKAELRARDEYQTLVATLRACHLLASHAGGGTGASMRLEAERSGVWDDIIETRVSHDEESERHYWQIKRQLTPLSGDEFRYLLQEIGSKGVYHFAVPSSVNVQGVAELRTLHDVCRRARQPGANIHTMIDNASHDEASWIAWLRTAMAIDDIAVFGLVTRLRLEFLELEDALSGKCVEILAHSYTTRTQEAFSQLKDIVRSADGAADITGSLLATRLIELQSEIGPDRIYRKIGEIAAQRLWLHAWEGLSESLVRRLLPFDYVESLAALARYPFEIRWPGTDPAFETAFTELCERVGEFLNHFTSRSEPRGDVLGEDNSWRHHGPGNERREKEEAHAREWQGTSNRLLFSLVIAINRFGDEARHYSVPAFEERYGAHESLVLTNRGLMSAVYSPDEFSNGD